VALTPGASLRGLHDSIVNHLGNASPQLLLALHEETAVAIAHGYAKVTGKPMAAALHANVGLMNGNMAIFNAWCDRMPLLILGATGPVDAAKRRPWIDWIHTSRDQGALVRDYTKWDDQPASVGAARESLLRAYWMANTAPKGPVYINFDSELQEQVLREPLGKIEAARFTPSARTSVPLSVAKDAAAMLNDAKLPVVLAGRASRSVHAWKNRIAFAEKLGALVITDLRAAASFPTSHPLHAGIWHPTRPSSGAARALKNADLIVSLDWIDLAGALSSTPTRRTARVVHASLDHVLHRGGGAEYQALPAVDVMLAGDPDEVVAALLPLITQKKTSVRNIPASRAPSLPAAASGPITIDTLVRGLRRAVGATPVSLAHIPPVWPEHEWEFEHPLDYLGDEGGAGLGVGPGLTVGAALALQGSGRLPMAICGDGDFLMGATALWSAVHYRIPLLLVIANNQSFFNDEVHQERVARSRKRPVENRWIGQRMTDPAIDILGLARAQGAQVFGPVERPEDLSGIYAQAIAAVQNGCVAVVDVRIHSSSH
jgi:thiamine pyrophosphate-dependent acetolactate synthase large subunit-like protein